MHSIPRPSTLTGLRVEMASGANGAGSGTLAGSGDDVTWTAPGDSTAGTAVSLPAYATAKVFAAASSTKYVLVTRTTSEDLDCSGLVTSDGRPSTLEQLNDVDDAIARTMNAEEARIGDESIRRSQLAQLESRRAALEKRYLNETGRRPAAAEVNMARG